jgi:hypothetical protein
MHIINLALDLPHPSTGEWIASWIGMPSSVKPIKPTKLQEVPPTSPSKIIFIEEIFQDISKQMLETNYTLNLGQLIKITLDLKKYLSQKLKANKPHINTRLVNEKTTLFIVLNI